MAILRKSKELLRSSLDLLFPDICRCCGRLVEEPHRLDGICTKCLDGVVYVGQDVCCRCGTPFPGGVAGGHHCSDCLLRLPSFDRAVSIAVYDGAVRKLLRNLKYRADTKMMPALGTIFEMSSSGETLHCDTIVPVPLHGVRLRKRGLNQSLALARILFPRRKELIRPTVLQRVRDTDPQTGLGGAQRRKNLKGAFQVTDFNAVCGRNVLLVDDVYTTGTTVEECSRTLKRGGAARVEVVTFARVLLTR